jgi:hypothetical protein
MDKRVQRGRFGVPVVDGGDKLLETVGPFFVQDGPTDLDRVRFKPGDRLYVTDKLVEHLVAGGAARLVKPKLKRKSKKQDKAQRAEEDKGAD